MEVNRCTICLLEFTETGEHRIVALKCGHLFCSACMATWYGTRRSALCPQCCKNCKQSDVRPIYATNVIALDTSKQIELHNELVEHKNNNDGLKKEIDKLKTTILMLNAEIFELRNRKINTNFRIKKRLLRQIKTRTAHSGIIDYDGVNKLILHTGKTGLRKINDNDTLINQDILVNETIKDFKVSPYEDGLLLFAIAKQVRIINLLNNNSVLTRNCATNLWSVCFDHQNRSFIYAGDEKGAVFCFDIDENTMERYEVCDQPIHSLYMIDENVYCASARGVYRSVVSIEDGIKFEKVEIRTLPVCTSFYAQQRNGIAVFRDENLRVCHFLNSQNELFETKLTQKKRRRDKIYDNFFYCVDDKKNKLFVFDAEYKTMEFTYSFNEYVVDFVNLEDKTFVLTKSFIYEFI